MSTQEQRELERPCIDHGQKGHLKGYGWTWRDGKARLAHRVVFCDSNGLKIDDIDGVTIRHRCDNGRSIEPTHLLPGTHDDNMRDRDERGRTKKGQESGGAVLTDEQVAEIRSSYKRQSRTHGTKALARKYGVHPTTIGLIVNRKSWRHLP